MKDSTKYGIGANGQTLDWNLIPWDYIEESIRKLRRRIFRATREQNWNQVRSLTKLMLRSYLNLLVSVRRVTQKNKGRKTAGVDGAVALTSKARWALVRRMVKQTLWKVKPARRIYIPKAGKPGQRRPLGIPVISDRVAQAMMKNALEPCWEAQFESNSYGFRPGRSIHDAVKHCWLFLKGNGLRPWVLDADIRSAFDKISHDHIMNQIGPIPGRELVRQWLKAGYVESEIFFATESGTPQGGIISPTLLNVALNGLQQMLGPTFGYVRYADDFIVCASTREKLESARSSIQEWLKPRGLELHPEKTKIVHIDDGFDFLSFSFRRFRGKCLFKPQKSKVLAFLSKIRLSLNMHRQGKAEDVIRHLNPIIRGWANHYRHGVSKGAFSFVRNEIWKAIWTWCLRRHRTKGKHWVRRKYFGSSASWCFQAQTSDGPLYLFDIGYVNIERHIKVRGCASPDDPDLADYWFKRKDNRNTRIRRSKVTMKTLLAELDA